MNPAYDRYEDRHVRGDRSLVDAAEEYVQGYVGEFLFLLDCRDRLATGQRLTVGQVRGVLNCMRSDPRVGALPVPETTTTTSSTGTGSNVINIAMRRSVRRSRPPYFDVPVRWHLVLGISNHKLASVVHRVDRTSTIRYYPHAVQDRFEDRFQCRIRWVCTPSWGVKDANVELLTEDHAAVLARQPGWKYCRQCHANPTRWAVVEERVVPDERS